MQSKFRDLCSVEKCTVLQLSYRCLWRNNYFPSSKRRRREASCQASDVMMQATSMGSYEGTLIWRFRLFFFDGEILSCVSFLIKVFHKLTIHFHYCRRRHSQFSSGSPQATLCFDQRPTRDTDAGPESLNTHT